MEFFYFTRPCMSPRGELTRLADRRGATIAARKTVGKARGVPSPGWLAVVEPMIPNDRRLVY